MTRHNDVVEAMIEQLDAARREVEELRAWQLAVADGLGFIERAEGQGGYRVASAATIVDWAKTAERERDEWYDAAAEVEELRGQVERLRADLDVKDGAGFMAVTEIARLRAENERNHAAWQEQLTAGFGWRQEIESGLAEIARMRSLLKGALVPCDRCDGAGSVTLRADCTGRSWCPKCGGQGRVPFEVEP